ncbi:hypothetical protein LCGC14_1626220 [marine sediment metagenome]|uniref:Uncharacterized protein n=1 Tax=marine sediment metagenome TaxID=412755 RepID=A0A0F9IQZ2_9ZZZZ
MKRIAIAIIAAALMMGCIVGSASSEPVVGFVIEDSPACDVDDLSPESMALITRWYNLCAKAEAGTITDEERAEGSSESYAECGYLNGDIPVTIILLDGTILLARMPDGSTMGLTSDGFRRNTDPPSLPGE